MIPLASVILVCSFIQSLFGVGLLVFGTPALLFLGYSFPTALFYLLPCSILISSLQLNHDMSQSKRLFRSYLFFLAPAAALGAIFVFWSGSHLNARPIVGVMLLLSAFLRFSEPLRRGLAAVLAPNFNIGLAFIGFVHGMTNMGGGLLTALANTISMEKKVVRANIALGYLIMAAVQWILLVGLKGFQAPAIHVFSLMAISLTVYWSLGRKIFSLSSQRVYQHSMTALMFCCGLLLLR